MSSERISFMALCRMLYHAFYKAFINLTEQKKVIAEKLTEKNKATTSEAALTGNYRLLG